MLKNNINLKATQKNLPKLYLEGRGDVNLVNNGQHSDFFWQMNSDFDAENLLYNAHTDEDLSLLDQMPGVTVEVDIQASDYQVWELVSDINVASKFSDEFLGANWSDDEPPVMGSTFIGRRKCLN